MLQDALLAWLHYVAMFLLITALACQAALLRPGLTGATALRLGNYDRLYLACAIAALFTGLARLMLGPKGITFYMPNGWFHAKMALFIIIGLCSVKPTLQFLRWRRLARTGADFAPVEQDIKRTRRWVMLQAHLVVLLPLCAVMMSRGIGL